MPDRRDWVQPVKPGFAQDNFLGMAASDYGGGTPIVDVWRRDGGIAVGHLERTPQLVSLPVHAPRHGVQLAICGRAAERTLAARARRSRRHETFVAVHTGDYFAALDAYRRLMAERGLCPRHAPAGRLRADLVCLGLRARLHRAADRGHVAQGEGTGAALGRHR